MLIDTHCHLNFEAFATDWQTAVKKAKAAGVGKMIVVGADIDSCLKAIEMIKETDELYAAIGFHPHHVKALIGLAYARVQICQITDQLKKLAKSKKVVAIGECGLDYHAYKQTKYREALQAITPEVKTLQKQLFGMQIQLAKELKLAMIIHSREAHLDTLDTLDHFCKNDGKLPRGVFHCISGNKKELQLILDKGFYVGVDGNVTYSQEVQALARLIPLNKLLLETDSPWLTPAPHRTTRNQPENIKIIAKYLAKITKNSVEKIEKQTTKNAEDLFRLQ